MQMTSIASNEELQCSAEAGDHSEISYQELNNDNVLTRLSTLSKKMSHMNASEMEEFEVNEKDFDLEKILKFISVRTELLGIPGKSMDVEFQDLKVVGKNESTQFVPSVGDIFFGPIFKLKDRLSSKPKVNFGKIDKERYIIRSVSGLVKSGEMLLVLGRPGAGCTTLLKALAGETQTYIKTEGRLTFSGADSEKVFKRFKNEIVYNPELDVHFPFLTVEQTLDFAIGCRAPNLRFENLSRTEYVESMKNLWATVFGLRQVLHTLVGSETVRGVSGGQRKRVSIAEAMVTRASVFCFDNATRGLDASTALEFAEALRTATNVTKCASIVTAYQASESIYEKFDLVTVLFSGRQIYFGPANQAKNYFVRMGYYCPPRQASAEYLTSITDPLGRTVRKDHEGYIPYTAEEFETYWIQSEEFKRLNQLLEERNVTSSGNRTLETYSKVRKLERMKYTRSSSVYSANYYEQLKLCFRRGFQRIVNNKAYTISMSFASIFQSLIVGSLYYNTTSETIGAFGRGGVLFFSLLFFSLMGLAEVAAAFEVKPILTKQRGYTFYHPSAELLGTFFTQLPIKTIASTIFSLIVYFLSGLKRQAGAFFSFLLFLNICVNCIHSLFLCIASFAPTLALAGALTGLTVLPTVLYSSYMIHRPSMVPWFKWMSYMDPILYAFESMISMEFHGSEMNCSEAEIVPIGVGYENVSSENQVCSFPSAGTSTVVSGDTYLAVQFEYSFSHVWRNFGILVLFLVGYLAVNSIVIENFHVIPSSSDKLLFVKGANVDPKLIEALNNPATTKDDESSIEGTSTNISQVKQENKKDLASRRASRSSATKNLGSNDIFSWQNVDYVIPYEGGKRKLLDNVSGYVKPGQLTALMGESGAGKTTLLNALSQRIDFGVVTGDMLVNGNPLNASFQRRTGYVQQQDLHIAQLTVRESLIFAARLRRPLSVPDEEKIAYVDTIMEILHMEPYADALAGQLGFGLNVEQRKKLSIATELVAKPSLLLFLDEPTSGLDSQSAWSIVQVMKQLANAGQAVLCTIHQPSATLFEEFDRLLLLKTGGQTVYFGDIGENSRTLLDYFETNGARPCESHENPAEYMLDVIGAGATASIKEDWNKIWNESPEYQKSLMEIEELLKAKAKIEPTEEELNAAKFVTPYLYQFQLVVRRTGTQFYRNTDYIMAKLFLCTFGGLIVGFSFWNVKHTVIGLQNLLFANFLGIIIGIPLVNQMQACAMESRELYEIRESKSNTFHWACLLVAQLLNELPYSFVFSTIYFVIWYFTVQLNNSVNVSFFWWFSYCLLYQLYYVSLGLWYVYMCPNLPVANIITSLSYSFMMAFCGVVQPPALMPGFWKFMWRVSPMTYLIDNFMSTLAHNRPVVCAADELSYLNPPEGMTCGEYLAPYYETAPGYVYNPNATSQCGVCQYSVGDQYLKTVGMSRSHRWRNVGLIFGYISFNIFAMLFFYYMFRVRKVSVFKVLRKKSKKSPKSKEENPAQPSAGEQSGVGGESFENSMVSTNVEIRSAAMNQL